MTGSIRYAAIVLVLSLGLTAQASRTRPASPPDSIQPNDNQAPGGRLHGDTLDIRLEVRLGTWRPEADDGAAIEVAAFAEEGEAPRIPGPLIRVPAGTTIKATVRNSLADSTIHIRGLVSHPSPGPDSLTLRPGASREVVFAAGAPGTYLYRAILGKHAPDRLINDEREQVAGGFIVDPPGGSAPDRLFVINIWGSRIDSTAHTPRGYRNAITINGRSWPWTERLTATTGDTIRWRVINASGRTHPMHLHGFYYEVDSHGNSESDSVYVPDDRRMVVTEEMRPFTTLAMKFVPNRPGNWLYHCHVGFHVVPQSRLDKTDARHDASSHDPMVHMAGLALGFTVSPGPGWSEPPRTAPSRMRLFIDEGTPRHRAPRALGFVLQRDKKTPQPDSVEIPGSLIVLTRDQPTDIVVINRLREAAAIHWHGIELLSYSDGVAGWSGDARRVAPAIMPGDSFVAHLVLPRAGTFIYHTHLNDLEQLGSGLYGAIVVLEPGQRFDARRDHVYIAGWDSQNPNPPRIIVNGDSLPAPLMLKAGVPNRFRFVNIGIALPVGFSIYRDSTQAQWRALAKDGMDLPAHRAVRVSAGQLVQVGETYDFEFTPERGEYRLVMGLPAKPIAVQRLIVNE